MAQRTIVVVGGTSGIGLEIARRAASEGDHVVLTGRDQARADEIAGSLGAGVRGLAVDISEPETIAASLSDIEQVDGLVLAAIERDANTIEDYDVARARRLVVLKLVGYAETVHTLSGRMTRSGQTGIVLFGGRAKDIPYPGSTTVSTINGGVEGLTNTLAVELARSGSTRFILASSATARSGRANPIRCSTATARARRAATWRRWPTSSTPPCSCCAIEGSQASSCMSTVAGG